MRSKVLHIVESLDKGAVENWLVRTLRHARAREIDVDWTFYCILDRDGALDSQAGALGANIVKSPVPIGRKLEFVRALRRELRKGQYDVLHCHHDLVSALYLVAAWGLPIRKRLVHVHNADEQLPTSSRFKQKLYLEPMRRLCLGAADSIVGISNHTLDTFLTGRRRRIGRDLVHYYGVETSQFRIASPDRTAFRRELGLAEDAKIVLFAGRIVAEKNPLFGVDVFTEMHRLDRSVVAVYVGAGSLADACCAVVRERGLDAAFRYLGWRDDVPTIMRCCDWFLLPRPEHPMEGFGLAVVEAQLAGLRMLLSLGVPDDPLLPNAVYRRMPLAAGPAAWSQAGMELLRQPTCSQEQILESLRSSPMDMDRAFAGLTSLYA